VLDLIHVPDDHLPTVGWFDDLGLLLFVGRSMGAVLFFVGRCVAARENFAEARAVRGVPPASRQWQAEECAVCLGAHGAASAVLSPCGHRFCGRCAEELRRRRMPCPLCRERILRIGRD